VDYHATMESCSDKCPIDIPIALISPNKYSVGVSVEYHATMESCSDKFHADIPNVM
jgi:hypothetical protein